MDPLKAHIPCQKPYSCKAARVLTLICLQINILPYYTVLCDPYPRKHPCNMRRQVTLKADFSYFITAGVMGRYYKNIW